MAKNYDIIIPFGYRCFCSMKLRKVSKQFESFPFDWIMYGNLETVINIVAERFADFLQLKNLQPVDSDTYGEHLDTANGLSFMHDFENFDTAASFPAVRKRYDRRIARFYERINAAKSVLFLHYAYQDMEESELSKLFQKLSESFPNKKVDLAFVYESNNPDLGWQYQQLSPHLVKCRVYNPEGMEQLSAEDKRFFKTVHLSLKTRLRSFIPNLKYKTARLLHSKGFIKFISCFIPGKERRQKLRMCYRINEVFRQ